MTGHERLSSGRRLRIRDIVDVVSASRNRPDNQDKGYNKVVIRSYDFTGTTFFPTSRRVAAFFVLIFTDRVSGGNLVTRHFGFCSRLHILELWNILRRRAGT